MDFFKSGSNSEEYEKKYGELLDKKIEEASKFIKAANTLIERYGIGGFISEIKNKVPDNSIDMSKREYNPRIGLIKELAIASLVIKDKSNNKDVVAEADKYMASFDKIKLVADSTARSILDKTIMKYPYETANKVLGKDIVLAGKVDTGEVLELITKSVKAMDLEFDSSRTTMTVKHSQSQKL